LLLTVQGYEVVLVLQLTVEAVQQLFREPLDLRQLAPHLPSSGYRNISICKGWNCRLGIRWKPSNSSSSAKPCDSENLHW